MSNRFDTALINREKGRQALAEALENQYAGERRNARIKRYGFVGAVLGLAFWGMGTGFSGAPDIAAITQTKKKLQDRKKIMSEIEKQMESGDQMMIGAGESAKPPPVEMTGDDEEDMKNLLAKSNGDADTYGNEKVPLNLAGEVRQKKRRQTVAQQGKDSLELGAPGVGRPKEQAQEMESLRTKRHARTPFDYGKYRPATPAESAKNPLPARSQAQKTDPGLYLKVAAPANRRLAREIRSLEKAK